MRPVTYIKRVIDPKLETLINTPPFPEYPSGHSDRIGAPPQLVLTSIFGDNFAFDDDTEQRDGLAAAQLHELLGGGRAGRRFRGSTAASITARPSKMASPRGAASAAYAVALKTWK